ncbi:DUF6090 family protein [Flavobacteriaceae sp. LMIT009]
MIKFFRRIRQKLLSENRFNKYLLYAIGEILLVMVGILLALQVNNWNLKRKNNQLKQTYLERIVNDIKQDTININNILSEIIQNQSVIHDLTKSIRTLSDYSILDSVFTNYFTNGWIISEYISTDNTYIDLSQTGNMNILKNDELVDKIIAYYGYIKQVDNFHTVNKNWITPLDLEVAKLTSAFEIDPATSDLFLHKERIEALKNIQNQADLMERNAAGHYWINQSLYNNLSALKGVSKKLLKDLSNEKSELN